MKTLLKTGGSLLVLAGFASALAATPAAAQDAASLKALQAQILQLQQQLQKLQADSAKRDAEMMKKPDVMPAMPASALSVPSTVKPGSAIVTIPPNDKDASGAPVFNPNKPNGKFNLGGVTVTLGGFVDLTAVYRARDTNGDTPTPFTSIPLKNSPQYKTGELRAEAQNTRFAALAQGAPYDGGLVSAYAEADFSSAGISSTATQTNSYTLRIRQGYVQLDDAPSGLHALVGQAWSFAAPFKSGLTPRQEAIPYVAENNYIPGWFGDARQPQARVTADLPYGLAAGLSVESPYSSFGGTRPATGFVINTGSPVFNGSTAIPGTSGTAATTGLNPTVAYSYNTIPDIIAKAAFDPGFGHYEVFGLARFFTDVKETTVSTGNLTAVGGGVGANAYVSAVPGLLDVQANIAAGQGIGRYGPSALPDATYKADGTPAPVPEIMYSALITGHLTPKFDVYAGAGLEQESKKKTGTGIGLGNPTFNNQACGLNPDAVIPTGQSCTANVAAIEGFDVGAWYKLYTGGFGTVQAGASYEYVRRISFKGVGGAPTVGDNIFLAAMRFFPFN